MAILVPMYIEEVPNRNSRPTILLREGKRVGKKVVKTTLFNLTHCPKEWVDALRRILKGEKLASVNDLFAIELSLPHGHVKAVLDVISRLGLDNIIFSKRSRERDLVIAMIVERLIYPCSKLATTRMWHTTTLAKELGVEDADVDELYKSLDWLVSRQERIENKLAKRHLSEGSFVLYDISSSYYEGRTCPLARFGHDRDGKSGRTIIVYGVMTDDEGRPVAVNVYPGNTSDSTTVPDQVEKLRGRFGLTHVVLVGDRGMLTQSQIDKLKEYTQLGWIAALRSEAIRALVKSGDIQMSLFDKQDLAEITSPDYPGERLVVCFNPLLAEERRRKREELLAATQKELERISKEVARRTRKPLCKDEIALKAGKVINRFKVGKHFTLTIDDGDFKWDLNENSVRSEAMLDGIYVIRTSEPKDNISAEDVVRNYKNLSKVEQAFRTLKGIDIRVRPIRHRLEYPVRGHIFLCVLAYYVEWHMRKALSPLLFDDEELDDNRTSRNPVAPPEPSLSAKKKKNKRQTTDGLPVQSFDTLLKGLGTQCKNYCKVKAEDVEERFERITEPTPLQSRVFELLKLFPVP